MAFRWEETRGSFTIPKAGSERDADRCAGERARGLKSAKPTAKDHHVRNIGHSGGMITYPCGDTFTTGTRGGPRAGSR